MLCVLGEGRGHMTQAMAVKDTVEKAGHEVVSVVLGTSRNRQIPSYFTNAIKLPVTQVPTLEFKYSNDRTVNLTATVAGVIKDFPAYRRGLAQLKAVVRESKPDVILNFFEALTGVYALTTRQRPPVVAVAHQFMVRHPDYVRAPGKYFQQLVFRSLVRLAGSRSTQIALSLYEAPDLPAKNLRVGPPLLRRQLFALEPKRDGDFVLIYLLNHGYADQIIAWHQKNPQMKLHCFYDKPGAPAELKHDDTLTFHRLDGEKFLRMMAECKFVVSTAGFESLCEAAYLGKPLFVVPVENHVEQEINAIDATRAGLGVADKSFNLDRLRELPDRLPNDRFRAWVLRAGDVLLQTLEQAVKSQPRS
jgi:uncharacterized protein (TIGR00661 family)